MRATIAAAALRGASDRAARRIAALRSGSSTSRSVHHKRSPSTSASSSTIAAPLSAKSAALTAWCWSAACGYGTSTAGVPVTASSAKVDAPARGGGAAAGARAARAGGGVGVAGVVEVGHEPHAIARRELALFGLHVDEVALPADVQHLPVAQGAARHQRRDGLVDRARPLAA